MNGTTHKTGETASDADGLGPLTCFADVLRRQGLRFEANGRKAVASLAALPGIEREQNVRRWGPANEMGAGGELPRLRTVLDGMPAWPREMQIDFAVVLFRGTGLAILIGPPESPAGVSMTTLTQDAMLIDSQAGGLLRLVHEAELDGHVDNDEAANIQAVGDGLRVQVTSFLGRVITAATSRPLRRLSPTKGGVQS